VAFRPQHAAYLMIRSRYGFPFTTMRNNGPTCGLRHLAYISDILAEPKDSSVPRFTAALSTSGIKFVHNHAASLYELEFGNGCGSRAAAPERLPE